jgi:hypothetical protein
MPISLLLHPLVRQRTWPTPLALMFSLFVSQPLLAQTSAAPPPQPPPPQAPASAPAPASAKSPAAHARLRGQLLESGTRKPIVAARVALPARGLETLTDAEGGFTFEELEAGEVQIRIEADAHAVIEDKEQIRANVVTEVTYYTPLTDFETDDLVAVGNREKKVVSEHTLSAAEIESVPGANGDVLQAARNMPGLARRTAVSRSAGDPVVMRGESAGLVLVNGYPLLEPFHFDALRSAVGNGLIESVQISPGNYDARYGGTNAGVIDITTRRPATDGLHGYLQLDLFDVSALLEGPASENASWAVGARRSYIDGVLNLALGKEEKAALPTAPRYYDVQASYDWQHAGDRVRFNFFAAEDRLVALLEDPVENEPALRGQVDVFTRWFAPQLLWDRRLSEHTQLSSGISYLRSHFQRQLGQSLGADFVNDRITAKTALRHELTPWLNLRAGIDAVVDHYDYAVTTPRPTEEGPQPSISLAPSISIKDNLASYSPSVYVATDLQLGPLLLVPAVRVDHFSKPAQFAGDTLVQPRLNARLDVGSQTVLKAGAGMYSKPAWIYQQRERIGNSAVEAERSVHTSAGFERRFGEGLNLDVTGFYNQLYHQVSAVADPDVRYDNRGRGRSYGGEFLLRYDHGRRFYGWAAYTLSRAERRESGEDAYHLWDFDQTHHLNITAQYRASPKWEIGARFRYVTGDPLTPVVNAVYDSDGDVYSPVYGATNSARAGAFHQLDLRVDRHWTFDTWRLTAYLDVQNVYNRANPQGLAYNYDYSESKVNSGANLPLIPSFGVKGEF